MWIIKVIVIFNAYVVIVFHVHFLDGAPSYHQQNSSAWTQTILSKLKDELQKPKRLLPKQSYALQPQFALWDEESS